MCVCVRACVRARVRVRACVHVRVRVLFMQKYAKSLMGRDIANILGKARISTTSKQAGTIR